MRERLLTNLIKVIRFFFFKAKQNSSAFRFSVIKPDQNVSPPCCYWLLKEQPWHHYENRELPACFPPSSPPASHTHTSSLTSALSFQILSISSLRCFCRCCHTPVAFWPTPPPQPSSSIPLHHLLPSPPPSFLPPFLPLRVTAHELFTDAAHLGIFLSSDRSKTLYMCTTDDLHVDIKPPQKKG